MLNNFTTRRFKIKRSISPAYLVLLWFGSFVLLGSILLWLPFAHNPGHPVSFFDAAFTAVSASCVTGLTVGNVADAFSFWGQLIIVLLLEMGGIGIMSFAYIGFDLIGRRASMSYQAATADALFQNDSAREFKRVFRQILVITLMIQAVGACLLFLSLLPDYADRLRELPEAVWSAIFHSVSAFCNGGFMVYHDGMEVIDGNAFFIIILLVLITLGGLGHRVLVELRNLPKYIRQHEKKPHWISLNTRVVLIMTGVVILFGCIGVSIFDVNDNGYSPLRDELFVVISGRTAGFTTVPIESIPLPSILILITLMFIGGSPGSCAGGIKTTSLAIWLARVKANLRNDSNVNIFGYTIAPDLVSRARILMALTMMWNLLGVFILVGLHPHERLETLIFEQVSAFGTVGLSMNFTPRLETASRLWIMLSMFIGRLGPLSIALWMAPAVRSNIQRPIGRIMVG